MFGHFLQFEEFSPEHFPQLIKVDWDEDPVPPVLSFPQLGAVEEIVRDEDPRHPAHLRQGDVQLVGGVTVLQADLENKGRYYYYKKCNFILVFGHLWSPQPSFMLNYHES